ncbi:hypothetical protein WDU94_008714 [Cyamophila willieti]
MIANQKKQYVETNSLESSDSEWEEETIQEMNDHQRNAMQYVTKYKNMTYLESSDSEWEEETIQEINDHQRNATCKKIPESPTIPKRKSMSATTSQLKVESDTLKCSACGRECKSIQGLLSHQRNAVCKEILESPTKPKQGSMSATTSQLKVQSDTLECSACGRECKSIQGLLSHQRNAVCKEILESPTKPKQGSMSATTSQLKVESDTLECSACGRECKSIQGLLSHQRNAVCKEILESPTKPKQGSMSATTSQLKVESDTLECSACGRECKSIQGLMSHQRNATCKEILESPTKPKQGSMSATTSQLKVESDTLECSACGRECKSIQGLLSHQRNAVCKEILESPTKPKQGSMSATTSQLKVESDTLECSACGRECKSIQGLMSHQRNATCKEILESRSSPARISQQQYVSATRSQQQYVPATRPQQYEYGNNSLECSACGRECKTIQGLMSHQRGAACKEILESRSSPATRPQKQYVSATRSQQQYVPATRPQQYEYGNNSLECSACGRECKTIQGLMSHQRGAACKEILESRSSPATRPQKQYVSATRSQQQYVPATRPQQYEYGNNSLECSACGRE